MKNIRFGILIVLSVVGFASNGISESVTTVSTIDTYAGPPTPVNGSAASGSAIGDPTSVVADNAGGFYFTSINRLYRVSAGALTIVAGSTPGFGGDGGPATSAQLSSPNGLAMDASGNIFIVDTGNIVSAK
jgi:hypothetical protein